MRHNIRQTGLFTFYCLAMFCLTDTADAQDSFIYSSNNAIMASTSDTLGGGAISAQSIGNPGVPSDNPRPFDVSFGFLYLRPIFANSGLRLQDNSPLSQALGAQNDLNAEFTFVPRLAAVYQFESEWGVGASAEYFNIIGVLRRDLTLGTNGNSQTGTLNATNRFRLLSVNLGEIIKNANFTNLFDCDEENERWFHNLRFTWTFGPRLVFVDQYYAATLTATGSTPSTVTATQDFSGLGITMSSWAELPVNEQFSVYSGLRGSILMGQNNRSSDLAGPDLLPNGNVALSENKSTILPIGELEFGISYTDKFGKKGINDIQKDYFVRIGINGQYWGRAGYITANDTDGFRDRPLYLVGFTILAGIQY